MDLIVFMEGLVYVREILEEEFCYSFAWRSSYMCPIHGLNGRKRSTVGKYDRN